MRAAAIPRESLRRHAIHRDLHHVDEGQQVRCDPLREQRPVRDEGDVHVVLGEFARQALPQGVAHHRRLATTDESSRGEGREYLFREAFDEFESEFGHAVVPGVQRPLAVRAAM
jgi:hypothetical protein